MKSATTLRNNSATIGIYICTRKEPPENVVQVEKGFSNYGCTQMTKLYIYTNEDARHRCRRKLTKLPRNLCSLQSQFHGLIINDLVSCTETQPNQITGSKHQMPIQVF